MARQVAIIWNKTANSGHPTFRKQTWLRKRKGSQFQFAFRHSISTALAPSVSVPSFSLPGLRPIKAA